MRATEPGGLEGVELEWDPRAAVTVVLASRGYPESSSSGDVISGLDATCRTGVEVLHAGTAESGDERRHGGRPGAQRHRARATTSVPPGTPRMLPPT